MIKFAGIQKTSFIDYEGLISAVFFTKGCNFACPYCHNGHLLSKDADGIEINEEDVFSFLEKRKNVLQAIVISGGEPSLHAEELIEFLRKIREAFNFKIKLDSNGTNPELLSTLLEEGLIDYVAMDIKAPYTKYHEVTGVLTNVNKIKESVMIIKSSGIDYEFRTTVCNELLDKENIETIINAIKPFKRYYLQNYKEAENVLAGRENFTPVTFLDEFIGVENVYIR